MWFNGLININKSSGNQGLILVKICLIFAVLLAFVLLVNGCAFARDIGGGGGFVVRQQVSRTSGVLVCKPVSVDTDIFKFIAANSINSIEDYSRWLEGNIKYKRDENGDSWSRPDETLLNKYGDCEDYAFLNAAVLRVLGYTPKVLAMSGISGDHAICVFEKDGVYVYIDNDRIKTTKSKSMPEFAKYVFSEHDAVVLLSVSFDTKRFSMLYKKSETMTM